jgi:hypothetical protein
VRVPEHCFLQLSISQVGALQARPLHARPIQTSPLEPGLAEIDLAQPEIISVLRRISAAPKNNHGGLDVADSGP